MHNKTEVYILEWQNASQAAHTFIYFNGYKYNFIRITKNTVFVFHNVTVFCGKVTSKVS